VLLKLESRLNARLHRYLFFISWRASVSRNLGPTFFNRVRVNMCRSVLWKRCVLFQRLETISWEQQQSVFDMLDADIHRGSDGGIYLPSTDPECFQRMIDFLQNGTIRRPIKNWNMEKKLYLLADIIGAHELMNRLMDQMQLYQLRSNTHFSMADIRWILTTLDGSPLSW
jgi:hypothetical protein